MRRLFVPAAIGIAAFALVAAQPAQAFVTSQQPIAKAAAAATSIVEVNRAPSKGRPPGWSHGRKTGWHGHSRPPGQI